MKDKGEIGGRAFPLNAHSFLRRGRPGGANRRPRTANYVAQCIDWAERRKSVRVSERGTSRAAFRLPVASAEGGGWWSEIKIIKPKQP